MVMAFCMVMGMVMIVVRAMGMRMTMAIMGMSIDDSMGIVTLRSSL